MYFGNQGTFINNGGLVKWKSGFALISFTQRKKKE